MRRYLIVDDNRAFGENLAEILEDQGAEVAVVSGGESALVVVAQTRFDALVTDMRMPVMGGAELVQRIRRIDPGLPAVVITAYTDAQDLAAARKEGLLAVLPKPAPIGMLIELLAVARRDGLVALVEDDRHLADNLCEILRCKGFSAVTAASVSETERLDNGLEPFVALCDLRVPGGPDGEALRQLAAKFPRLPLLVITAYAASFSVAEEKLFTKPFDVDALLATIEGLYPAAA